MNKAWARRLRVDLSAIALAAVMSAAVMSAAAVAQTPAPSSAKRDPFTPPTFAAPYGKDVRATLDFDVYETKIFDPSKNIQQRIALRAYSQHLTGPTIRVLPGQTARVTLNNKIDPERNQCVVDDRTENEPNCFNWTGLHTHGLWVSPTGNSDNPFVTVRPGESFPYEFNIPSDHPAGTFWYHPHRHGSSAIQVTSGASGALIIDGVRKPTVSEHGDVDLLVRTSGGEPVKERIMLFQELIYACRTREGQLRGDFKKKVDARGAISEFVCDEKDLGTIEYMDQVSSHMYSRSGRYRPINGVVRPTIRDAVAGRLERWRLINGGNREEVNLTIRAMAKDAPDVETLPAAEREAFVKTYCTGAILNQWEFAVDGLTRKQMQGKDRNLFYPGNRSDILVRFPEQGRYCVVDNFLPEPLVYAERAAAINQDRALVTIVDVTSGAASDETDKAQIVRELSAAAESFDADIRQVVRRDLADDLKLTAFTPHADIPDGEISGAQRVVFSIESHPDQKEGEFRWGVNAQRFGHHRIGRVLKIGSAEEWTISSSSAVSHNFHLHVNAFQVVKVLDGKGRDVTDPSVPRATRLGWEKDNLGFVDTKGLWMDTIYMKQGYKVVVRIRYERYTGDALLHCHFIDHQDRGMMEMVRYVAGEGEPSGGGPMSPSQRGALEQPSRFGALFGVQTGLKNAMSAATSLLGPAATSARVSDIDKLIAASICTTEPPAPAYTAAPRKASLTP
ncbi:MAG: multicopper oxidase [Hyphomicrobiales bacterium]|nr:multicopper oxidase [Hyphomicrobiales bacterium]